MIEKSSEQCSPEEELEQLFNLGEFLNLDLGKIEKSGSELNFVAIRSENYVISRRLDSRTLLIQDLRYGKDKNHGDFDGSDEELIAAGQQIFEAFALPTDEVTKWKVLVEQTQIAEVASENKYRLSPVAQGAKILRLNRQIKKLNIWSSNLSLKLSSQGTIAFLQAHWPEFPQQTIDEGCRLDYLVNHGWSPPPQEGASPQSLESGIIHSPAISFVMDIYPAIRVIYEPWNQRFGRKLMLHFDRHGRPIPEIRHADNLPRADYKSRPQKRDFVQD